MSELFSLPGAVQVKVTEGGVGSVCRALILSNIAPANNIKQIKPSKDEIILNITLLPKSVFILGPIITLVTMPIIRNYLPTI